MTGVLSLYSRSLAKPADNFIGNCALLFYKKINSPLHELNLYSVCRRMN